MKKSLKIYTTDVEYEQLRQAAERAGDSMSGWVLKLALAAAQPVAPTLPPAAPVPPPLPPSATPKTARPGRPDGRELVVIMRQIAENAEAQVGGHYRLSLDEHHMLETALCPYDRYFKFPGVMASWQSVNHEGRLMQCPSEADALHYNLAQLGHCWAANGVVDMVHEADWGMIQCMEEDLPTLESFGKVA